MILTILFGFLQDIQIYSLLFKFSQHSLHAIRWPQLQKRILDSFSKQTTNLSVLKVLSLFIGFVFLFFSSISFLAPLAEGQRAIVMAWGRRASVRSSVRPCVRP